MNEDIFENAYRVDADLFHTDKKDPFSKYLDTCGRGLILFVARICVEQTATALG